MKLKTINTKDAVGQVLCHDITQIVPGEFKGAKFKKGHIVREEDIEVLLSLGKDVLYVWEDLDGFMHENEAASSLKELVMGEYLEPTKVSEGKISLKSKVDGVLKINTDLLFKLNMIDEVIVSTKPNLKFVKKGDIVASTRVIPLLINEEKIIKAQGLVDEPIINILPLQKKKVGMVTTGNEVYYGRIQDKFKDAILPKLEAYDCDFIGQTIVPDELDKVQQAIQSYLDNGAELIICTGGMSVDPSDITPEAIRNTNSKIVTYGLPVLPGSMTLIAYNDKTPIVGLPAGCMFSKISSIDVILHRLLCDDVITREEVALYGNGGLL